MKGGRAATEATAAASEGGQKLSTRYMGAAEAKPLNYILLSVGGGSGRIRTEGAGGALTAVGAAEGP